MLEANNSSVETLSLDHHRIVTGICKALKLVERINADLKLHPDRVASIGQAVVGLIYEKLKLVLGM